MINTMNVSLFIIFLVVGAQQHWAYDCSSTFGEREKISKIYYHVSILIQYSFEAKCILAAKKANFHIMVESGICSFKCFYQDQMNIKRQNKFDFWVLFAEYDIYHSKKHLKHPRRYVRKILYENFFLKCNTQRYQKDRSKGKGGLIS